MVIPITERSHEYASKIYDQLFAAGIRVESDLRSEKMGYKIREAQLQKIPYMIVVGDKEEEQGIIALRSRSEGDLGQTTLDEFIAKLKTEIAEKK